MLDALDSVAARAGLALADCEVAESPQHALPLVNLGPFAGVDARLAEWLSAGGIARLFLEGHALAMLPYRVEVAP